MSERMAASPQDPRAPQRLECGMLTIPNGIALAAAAMAPVLAVVLNARKPGAAFPYDFVPIVVLIWLVVGIGLFLYYRSRSPKKIVALGSFIAEDDIPLDEQPESLLTARASSVQHPTLAEEHARQPEAGRGGR